jgi:hypothetical protein
MGTITALRAKTRCSWNWGNIGYQRSTVSGTKMNNPGRLVHRVSDREDGIVIL